MNHTNATISDKLKEKSPEGEPILPNMHVRNLSLIFDALFNLIKYFFFNFSFTIEL